MERFQFRNNRLWCEEVDLTEVVESVGTPVYCYSRQSIIDHCRWIEQAFGTVPHLSCYAVKANANPVVLRTVAGEGLGADVGSLGELLLALDAGFPPSKITLSGVGKSDEEITTALRHGVLSLNVESEEELLVVNDLSVRMGKRAKVLLRINFDIEAGAHPYTATGHRRAKFGLEPEEALALATKHRSLWGVEIVGLHSHLGSQIIDEPAFVRAAEEIVRLAGRFERAGFPQTHINFGGGFGVQYKDYVTHPGLPAEDEHGETGVSTVKLLQAVIPILAESTSLILIQPGRSVVAHAAVLLTRVLYRKQSAGKTYVIVDAGMNDLIRPSLYQSYHQIVPLRLNGREVETVDIVGPLCESGDYLALDRRMPAQRRGEYLSVMCAGAYGFVLSSNYNGRPRPAEVLVEGDRYSIITARESVEHIFAKG